MKMEIEENGFVTKKSLEHRRFRPRRRGRSPLVFSAVLLVGTALAADRIAVLQPPEIGSERIGGFLGQRMALCFEKSVKGVDGQYLSDVFKHQQETRYWQTEFWGKWMHAAVPVWQNTGDAELKAAIDASVRNVLAAQRPDGYIGNYSDEAQLNGPWDVWGRKYTMLGLLYEAEATGNTHALAAACRVADHLMTQVPAQKALYRIGNYHGMASCSVLEPIVWLYRRTGERKYLDFARYVVSQMDDPDDSAQLIRKALAGVDVGKRFPYPTDWYGWDNGMKAYEMMSCYQGLLEYYLVTGEKRCFDAAVATAQNIMKTEINIAGSGASRECWCGGVAHETEPSSSTMETCVTITWMRFCQTLLQITADPVYADQFEKSLYNAYLAGLSLDDGTFEMYGALEGARAKGRGQCGMTINCCAANGPRGFVAMMRTLALTGDDALYVNLYTESEATLRLGASGTRVTLVQTTDYPVSGVVRIEVSPSREDEFTLNLRIPAWSQATSACVNGTALESGVVPGTYLAIRRVWKAGDTVTLRLDMRALAHVKNGHLAITRGPITLARDARFNDGNVHEVVRPVDGSAPLPLVPVKDHDPAFQMVFSLTMDTGLYYDWPVRKAIHFCDFASAGNTWTEASALRVWMPLPVR